MRNPGPLPTRHRFRIPESLASPIATGHGKEILRFTLDGSDDLEAHLDHVCQRVQATLLDLLPGRKLEAIMLGGGYGRGEGGVLKTAAGDRPYNDMEFYVCLRGSRLFNERTYSAALHEAARELSFSAGVELEFKVCSLARLRHQPVDMFFHDLAMGHRWLAGDDSLLQDCEHLRHESRIPLFEATRLLLNRCSGLLFAKVMVEHDHVALENVDFIVRNLAKAQLALGDAFLTAHGRYHWSCCERFERLRRFTPDQDLPWLRDIQRHHADGVSFKLHPRRQPANSEQLHAAHAELSALALRVWLWLESRRLNHSFVSARDYALSPLNKCPDTSPWHNYASNLWHFGATALHQPGALRNPRERLLRALTLLLWEPATLCESHLLHPVQSDLQTEATSFSGLVAAYKSLWGKFS